MTKRSRKSSSESGRSDPINREITCLHSSIISSLSERANDASGQNGNKEIIIRSNPKGHFGKVGPTMQDLYNSVFPRLSFKFKSYGRASVVDVTGTTVTQAVETAVGNVRSLQCPQGLQGFFSFMHLPIAGILSSNLNSSAFSLNTLIETSSQANNVSTISGIPVQPPVIDLQSKYRSMFYQGGFTEHIFYNPGNEELVVEFWEVRPKRFLLSSETPLVTLALDKTINGFKQTGFASLSGTTYLKPENPDFTVGVHDHLFHDKFTCSNNRKIKVLGGETVKVFVKHPPFSLQGCSTLNSMVYGNYVEQLTSTTTDLDYVPFCTVWLFMRIQGQIVTNDGLTTTGDVTKVNICKGQLTHMQREQHNVRCGIDQNSTQTFESNGWADVITTSYLDNPLTDTQQVMTY